MDEFRLTLKMDLNDMLKEFIVSFEASLDPRLWVRLIEEETDEVLDAIEGKDNAHLLKECMDLLYVTTGFNIVAAGAEQLGLFNEEEHKGIMTKLNYAGDIYERGVEMLSEKTDLYEAFRRVHLSNMSKLDEDGRPIFNEAGKVLKGPNYKKPDLEDLV